MADLVSRTAHAEDDAELWALITHPKIRDAVSCDDVAVDIPGGPPAPQPRWRLIYQGSTLVGFWAFTYRNPVCWEAHVALLPQMRGRKLSDSVFRSMLAWLWKETKVERLVAEIPCYNRLAIAYARRNGMTMYGRNVQCWKKNGKLWDCVLMGISRPEKS